MADSFNIKLTDKPYLSKLLQTHPQAAQAVIKTFVDLMEESAAKGWHDLPAELHKSLTFSDLVKGVLRGSLDLPDINPEAFDTLRAEVHPLAMLSPRKNYVDGGMKYYNWRSHFQLAESDEVNSETVAKIFRKLLRYGRYVKIDDLQRHLEYNQIATYRGLGDVQMEKLPFFPALRYQRQKFGDLHVGKFFDENGFLDCGTLETGAAECPACNRQDLKKAKGFTYCLACNAGYRT